MVGSGWMDQDPKRAGNTEEGGGGEAGTEATSREDAGSSQPGRQQSAKGGLRPMGRGPTQGHQEAGLASLQPPCALLQPVRPSASSVQTGHSPSVTGHPQVPMSCLARVLFWGPRF